MTRHLVFIVGLLSLVSCSRPDGSAAVPAAVLTTSEVEPSLTYERVVSLQLVPEAALGGVTRAKIDPATGDILVADSEATKLVYRFSSEGRYLTRYGALPDGRSAYEHLADFVVLRNSDVVVFSDRVAQRFTAAGHSVQIVPLEIVPSHAVTMGNRIYVYAASLRRPQLKHTVYAFDENLTQVGSFHLFDERSRRYTYLTLNPLTVSGDRLFVSELYEPRISRYEATGRLVSTSVLASDDHVTAGLWAKERFTEEDRTRLRQHVDRFLLIQGFRQGVLVQQLYRQRDINRFALLVDHSNVLQLNQWPRAYHLVATHQDEAGVLLDAIVGSYADGVLGVALNPLRVTQLKPKIKALAHVDYKATDNPLLIFVAVGTNARE